MEESNPELESFRQQWRAEVSARTKTDDSQGYHKSQPGGSSKTSRNTPLILKVGTERSHADDVKKDDEDEEEHIVSPPKPSSGLLSHTSIDGEDVEGFGSKTGSREPRSALEHYEKAVEREAQGSLGDSLNLYRKAFRMDNRVDLKYKNKHFPPSNISSKSVNPNLSNDSRTVPNPGLHSLGGPPQSIKELIASFATLRIEPALPEIEGTPTLPSPIVKMPKEILIIILTELAIIDVASFARLGQVCKYLAYLVATEESIWKRVCTGSEVGFGAMHYQWQREITGEPLEDPEMNLSLDNLENEKEVVPIRIDHMIATESLLHEVYSSSWHQMFRLRPRLRFNGVYISTVNYIRPGQASPSQITWNSPVHIVTYYRYLRFLRDGTAISLLTTAEPGDVVRHMTKELLALHQQDSRNPQAHLPSAVMQTALRGRWRLSGVGDDPNVALKDSEGDVFVETEGVGGKDGAAGTKYIYRMELSLRNTTKAAKNNKLAWKGFWCYNRMTDDWGEFGLKNDKAFFWSRVKSYGVR